MRRITLTDDQYRVLVETLDSISDGHHQQSDEPCDEDELLKAIEESAEYIP